MKICLYQVVLIQLLSFGQAKLIDLLVSPLSLNEQQNQVISYGNDGLILVIEQSERNKNFDCLGNRLCFLNDNLFTFQPQSGILMYVYEMNSVSKQFVKSKDIGLNQGNEGNCLFPQLFINQKQLLVKKHDIYVNLKGITEHAEFKIEKSIQFDTNVLFGQLIVNGEYMITLDESSYEIYIRRFREELDKQQIKQKSKNNIIFFKILCYYFYFLTRQFQILSLQFFKRIKNQLRITKRHNHLDLFSKIFPIAKTIIKKKVKNLLFQHLNKKSNQQLKYLKAIFVLFSILQITRITYLFLYFLNKKGQKLFKNNCLYFALISYCFLKIKIIRVFEIFQEHYRGNL
ncbi:unnamed protein product [Paramecium pentaurelia]|uniref:Transmembrane protein n=1 Tax=Paramecium pentaurelia TaxID=43138 RepID=A0A8S1SSM7_9CILI|nr:unnamed protein product [Paramecium pentaurelia]